MIGEDVRAALSGGGADKMRDVSAHRRRVIDRLTDRAGEQLDQAGHATSRTTLDKVGDTLMAATIDQDAAEAVRNGRLTRELAPPSGFEALGGQLAAPARTASKRDREEKERVRRKEAQVQEAEEAAREAGREARRLEEQAERARKDAERARRRADSAAERAQELRRKAKEQTR
jgi:hypothetical protein